MNYLRSRNFLIYGFLFCIIIQRIYSATSIHQLEKIKHQYQQPVNKGNETKPVWLPLTPRTDTTITRIVYGYDPYWVSDQYLHFDLLTHIGCFDVTLNPDGSISNYYNFPQAWAWTINRAHRAGVKIEMVATCFGWYNIHQAITIGANNAINNLISMATNAGVDGINMDFEDILGSDRDTMAKFIQRLSAACHTNNLSLTMATMPIDFQNAYNFPVLAETTDGLFIMGYNYHWQGGPEAGPVAPLTGWNNYGNLSFTINTYLQQIGNGNKLILGLPYYGFAWQTYSDTTHSQTIGSGTDLYYRDARGYAQQYGKRWDNESQTPWYAYYSSGWHQGWYDDDTSMLLKYGEVINRNLMGTGMWALGYDGARTELWSALREAFNKPLANFTNGNCETWRVDTISVPSDTNHLPVAWYAGRKASVRCVSDYVHSGSYALKQIPISLGDFWPAQSIIFQDVNVIPGAIYEFSGWAQKNDGLGNQMKLNLEWFNTSHQVIEEANSSILNHDSITWIYLTTGLITSPANVSFARLKLVIIGNGNNDRWDDLSFSQVNAQKEISFISVHMSLIKNSVIRNSFQLYGNNRAVLFDISGRKITQLIPGNNNLHYLNAGVYFIKIKNNSKIYKVVKTK